MNRGIPGGRGPRYGDDFDVSRRESLDGRVRDMPPLGGWVLSNLPFSSASVTCIADRLVMYPCPVSWQVCSLRYARITVDTAVAGSTAAVGIYVFRGRADGFFLIPGTYASFVCSSAGQKSVRLDSEVQIEPGARCFMAFDVSSAAVGLVGSSAANETMLSPIYIEHSVSALFPSLVLATDVTKGPAISVPLVVYVSEDAAEVM